MPQGLDNRSNTCESKLELLEQLSDVLDPPPAVDWKALGDRAWSAPNPLQLDREVLTLGFVKGCTLSWRTAPVSACCLQPLKQARPLLSLWRFPAIGTEVGWAQLNMCPRDENGQPTSVT